MKECTQTYDSDTEILIFGTKKKQNLNGYNNRIIYER